MAAKRDYYEILGIDRSADNATIKRAYRKLAKKYHPDMNKNNPAAEERFKEVTEAYNVLSDQEKKKLYDQFGHAAFEEGAGASSSGFHGQSFHFGQGEDGSYQEFHFEGGNLDDILEGLFGHGMHQGSGGFGAFDRQGSFFHSEAENLDLYETLELPFTTAALGGEVLLQIPGGGRVSLTIKEGTQAGTKIRLKGKGRTSKKHLGQRGDFYVIVQIKVPEHLSPGAKRKLREFAATA